ncbi:hypothetical protein TRIXIE_65 [Mycobacterium phage Trixie]|uniref:Lipoprotein n=1 Tax=Mycobacterium phage Trixie TaxID=1071503 RepID=G1JV23_9CAUD|nr:hypothetical protein TRIXIE_65 [Mycobacterium phage Trixie]AEL17895.1 hypothetical protein TRIXIE_65 [Mycobacterium phage Trixie]
MKKTLAITLIAGTAALGLSACDSTAQSCSAAGPIALMSVEAPLAPTPRVPSIPRPPSPRISSPKPSVSSPGPTTINNHYGSSGTSPLLPFLGGLWAGDMLSDHC